MEVIDMKMIDMKKTNFSRAALLILSTAVCFAQAGAQSGTKAAAQPAAKPTAQAASQPAAQAAPKVIDWKTTTVMPGVDFTGMSKASRDVALEVLRSEGCNCGCELKIAECRVGDPGCGTSRRFAQFVVREASAGKNAAAVREALNKYKSATPSVLDEAITRLKIDGDPVRGNPNARVTIVEFSDFQCPFCAEAAGQVKEFLAKYPNDAKLVFKQFPLDTHSQAALSAEAALAAQAQGKFWEMHDKLYANFRQLSRVRILAWAKEIGLDMGRFQADLDSHKYASRVAAEEKEGEVAGVEGTPTFYIDGHKLNAAFDVATVAPLVVKK